MSKKISTLMRGIFQHAFWGKKRNKKYALSRPSDKQYRSNRQERIGRKGSKINLVKPSGQQINEQINTHDSRDKNITVQTTRPCKNLTTIGCASEDILLPTTIIPQLQERATHPQNEKEIIMEYVTEKNIRAAIIDQFVRVFNCPPEKYWTEIIRCVRHNLKLFEHKYYKRIRRTFKSVAMQLTRCNSISPDRIKRRITQKNMIDADSFDAQLIADMIEAGYSYQNCTIALNLKKNQMDLPFVTFSAVYGVANRLDPIQRTVKKRKQGSFNPDDKWSKVRKGWTKQLLVRLGKLKLNSEDGEEIQACYDVTKMPTINLPQVVFWDETHAKVQIGCTADYTTSFKRKKDGVLDK